MYQPYNFLLWMLIVEEYMAMHMWFWGLLQLLRHLCKYSCIRLLLGCPQGEQWCCCIRDRYLHSNFQKFIFADHPFVLKKFGVGFETNGRKKSPSHLNCMSFVRRVVFPFCGCPLLLGPSLSSPSPGCRSNVNIENRWNHMRGCSSHVLAG